MTDRYAKDIALSFTSDTWRRSIGICWGTARSDCGLFNGRLTICLRSALTPWEADYRRIRQRIGLRARKWRVTTGGCVRSWIARLSERWRGLPRDIRI